MDRDLVAGNAELRCRNRIELYSLAVDVYARSRLIRTRLDVINVRVRDYLLDSLATAAAVHRFKNITLQNPALAVDFGVLFTYAMTGDAGNAFTRHFCFLPQRHITRLVHRRADAGVAAHAEIANGSLREIVDLLLELVKDRRNRSVGMIGRAPFIINLLVTGRALRSAWVMTFR